jgi:hypothetical protein
MKWFLTVLRAGRLIGVMGASSCGRHEAFLPIDEPDPTF